MLWCSCDLSEISAPMFCGGCKNNAHSMMTSPNGPIFRVTGPLCGEFIGPGEFPAQRPVTRSFDVFFDPRMIKLLSEQPWAGDLRRHNGHYEVNVMLFLSPFYPLLLQMELTTAFNFINTIIAYFIIVSKFKSLYPIWLDTIGNCFTQSEALIPRCVYNYSLHLGWK